MHQEAVKKDLLESMGHKLWNYTFLGSIEEPKELKSMKMIAKMEITKR